MICVHFNLFIPFSLLCLNFYFLFLDFLDFHCNLITADIFFICFYKLENKSPLISTTEAVNQA